jgi:hypothetical protein
MNFIISHVFRVGNHCDDDLANVGLTLDRFTPWYEVPYVIRESFDSNRLFLRKGFQLT